MQRKFIKQKNTNTNNTVQTQEYNNQDEEIQAFNQYNFDTLPIMKYKRQILYAVEKYSLVIIVSETGSGKTTKIPQFLYEAGYALNNKQIAVTQPRRMAAISVAKRVSFELGLQIGKEIGYSVRFDQKHSDQTCVKYLTDGMLINEILADPLLQNYSIIMVDDIHERSMNTDLILGMLKKIRNKRKDLKLIVSSATLDAEKVEKFFKDDKFPSKILCVEGRKYDVDTFYLNNPCQNYVVQALQLAVTLHKEKNEGDILIFLTSQEEIEVFIQMMENLAQQDLELQNIILLPLYATLPLAQQMEVFKPPEFKQRKIIVATNIAESSITIDGIVYVIDSMFYKTKHYDYKKGYDQLVTIPISRSSADQRLGRAGRVSKGECYRLITEEDFNNLFFNSIPELLQSDLTDFILKLKQIGIRNVSHFDLIDKPSENQLIQAFEYLNSLQIIDDNGELTKKGEQVCELPLDTKTAVMIINSFDDEFQSSKEILILAAMISIQGSLFFTNQEPPVIINKKKKLGVKEGDHLTLINIYIQFEEIKKIESKKQFCFENKISFKSMCQAVKIYNSLLVQVKRMKLKIESSEDNIESILRTIITGYFTNIAQLQPNGYYKNVRNKELLSLHPYSLLTIAPPKYVVYKEIIKTNKLYIRECSEIDESWILELAGHFYADVRQQIANQRHETEIKEHMKEEKKQESLKVQEQIDTQKNLFVKKKISKDNNKGKLSFIKQKPKNQQGKNDIKKVKTNMLSFGDDDEDENM